MEEKTQKDMLADLQEKFDALPPATVLVPPTDDSDVKDVEFNALMLIGELWAGDFYIYPEDAEVIYTTCPLCGCDSGIYGGNRFYTQACCYFHLDMGKEPEEWNNISLRVERWTTEHLLAGEGVDEVHAKLTALRSGNTRRDYVERINAILHDERTAASYRKYLETGDDGSEGSGDDAAHEKAADAAERQTMLTDPTCAKCGKPNCGGLDEERRSSRTGAANVGELNN
jgi:hypothetical protein